MTFDTSTRTKFVHLDDAKIDELLEGTKVRIQRLRAEAASVRADQASIRAEIKRREWETES